MSKLIVWIPVDEKLPPNDNWKEYLVCFDRQFRPIAMLTYYDGWNCSCLSKDNGVVNREAEITDVIAWAELPEPYRLKPTFREWLDKTYYEGFDPSGLTENEYYALEDQYNEEMGRR